MENPILNINSEAIKAKKGDKEALLKLVIAQQAELYKFAFIYLRNRSDCEDVLQDLIVKLYEQIPKLRKPESFYPWAKRILVNLCRQKLNKAKRTILLSDYNFLSKNKATKSKDLTSQSIPRTDTLKYPTGQALEINTDNTVWTPLLAGSSQDLENVVTQKLDLLTSLGKLTKVQQDVIILHYFADLTLEDVGEVLGCPAGTVKSRLNKGLLNLKKNLGGDY